MTEEYTDGSFSPLAWLSILLIAGIAWYPLKFFGIGDGNSFTLMIAVFIGLSLTVFLIDDKRDKRSDKKARRETLEVAERSDGADTNETKEYDQSELFKELQKKFGGKEGEIDEEVDALFKTDGPQKVERTEVEYKYDPETGEIDVDRTLKHMRDKKRRKRDRRDYKYDPETGEIDVDETLKHWREKKKRKRDEKK